MLADCPHLGISVWLTAFAVLTVLPSSSACASHSDNPHLHSLAEYLTGRTLEAPVLGLRLREDRRELKSGASATGLLIVAVRDGSPAANAGLAGLQVILKKRQLVIGGGDLIIAVDGSRVTNFLDFENGIRDAQPGEIVYLTIVRAGLRRQVPIPIHEKEPEAK
jgi:S1-C subfamily serine protease